MTEASTPHGDDIGALLASEQRALRRRRWIYTVLLVTVAGAAAAGLWYALSDQHQAVRYQTVEARRGDLTVVVTATGTLQPVNQVEVGTEISGTVAQVEVDFNDRVRSGDVLARLDTEQLQARARQSEAALQLAKARVTEAEATRVETTQRLRRSRELLRKGVSSQEDIDTALAAQARAQAALAIAQAQVSQAQAQLDSDRTALHKALIRSPIDGIVLQRQVEPGQTVAASLQTPVLFVLAESLAQAELHVAVDEADVGLVREGQPAVFTVDAYPERRFPASIEQVRFAPQTVEGVVTYETVLAVDNRDLALRPGMTATAEITVQVIEQALLVPNAALRFSPPKPRQQASTTLLGALLPRRPRDTGNKRKELDGARHNVWVLQDGEPAARPVQLGANDGKWTELVAGDVQPGEALLVGMETRPR
jgi:HlyD family secretion protein